MGSLSYPRNQVCSALADAGDLTSLLAGRAIRAALGHATSFWTPGTFTVAVVLLCPVATPSSHTAGPQRPRVPTRPGRSRKLASQHSRAVILKLGPGVPRYPLGNSPIVTSPHSGTRTRAQWTHKALYSPASCCAQLTALSLPSRLQHWGPGLLPQDLRACWFLGLE